MRRIKLQQFKQMKSNKELLAIASNLTEMVLQMRINPNQRILQHVLSNKCQLDLLLNQTQPSHEILHFLINREFYQIRNRVVQALKNDPHQLEITIVFTIYDKFTSISQTAEIWKMSFNRISAVGPEKPVDNHQLLYFIKKIIDHLTAEQNLGETIKNKADSKRIILDFKIEVGSRVAIQRSELVTTGSMWTTYTQFSNRQCSITCYWRRKITLPFAQFSPYTFAQQQIKRVDSEETNADSCRSSKGSTRKYKSMDQQRVTFEVYDNDLDITIISSDSQSLSGSNKVIQEVLLGEIDEFQLLIDETDNDDELFMVENSSLLKQWQKYITVNFH